MNSSKPRNQSFIRSSGEKKLASLDIAHWKVHFAYSIIRHQNKELNLTRLKATTAKGQTADLSYNGV